MFIGGKQGKYPLMHFDVLRRLLPDKRRKVIASTEIWQGLQQLEPRLLLSGSGFIDAGIDESLDAPAINCL